MMPSVREYTAETLAQDGWLKGNQAHSGASRVTVSSSVLHGWDNKGNPVPFSLNVLNPGWMDVEIRDKENSNS